LLQTPGLLEHKLLQLRRLGVTEAAQPEVASNDLLVLGDRRLPFAVEIDQARFDPQLRCTEAHQLVEDLKWLLPWEAIEEPDEAELVGKAEPVVETPTLADLCGVVLGQGGGAFELMAREHCPCDATAINFNLWPGLRPSLELLQNQGFQQAIPGRFLARRGL
jgi:hypothetical protein